MIEPPSAVQRRRLISFLCAVLLLGAVVRVAHLGLRTLRGDEQWFAAIVERPTWSDVEAGLREEKQQAIPAPLFVAAEHLAVRLFDPDRLALRLWPCVAGIFALLALHRFARRFAPPLPCAILFVCVAFSPLFVYWSKDAKPYTLELALFLALGLAFERARQSAYAWSALAAGAAIAVLSAGLSYASFFTFPLFGAIAAWDARGMRRERAARALGFAALLAALLLAVYLGWVRHRRNAYLDQFWVYYFAPFSRPGDLLEWHLWRFAHMPNRLFVGSYAGLLGTLETCVAIASAICAALGAWSLRRALPARFHLYAFGPLALAYVASAAGIFPFEDRLLLFALALPLLYFAAGLAAAWQCRATAIAVSSRALIATLGLGFAAWPVYTEIASPATGAEHEGLRAELASALSARGDREVAWYELATNPTQFYFDYVPKQAPPEQWIHLPGWFGFPYRERHAEAVARWLELHADRPAVLVFLGERGFDLERRAVLERASIGRRLEESFFAPRASAYVFSAAEPGPR